ncbi:NAD(P)/FAD-dependent oxidoreductase [Planctomonas sp. JC2975]|uniref:FAD-dependent oxidoreductase n=1 Tax=Planctomonas sp. JC2975 TaxID=2729626 RepID=UPI001475964D|nr:NAD(P)/FAD-dependent oxidoreductase [Planctomonas sp. JC2975]
MNEIEYDVIVIGGGAVGENVADRAVQGGMKTVLVESELVGGECSYWACMPSKALLRSAALLRAARNVDGAEQAVTGDLDVAAVLRRRDKVTSNWKDDGQVEWLNGANIDLVRGHARLTGPKRIEVTGADDEVTVITARHAVAVCTGSASLLPDVPGLIDADPWTSRDATSVHEVPSSLAIIGGGVVAVEMATAYAGFGVEVTVIARSGLLGKNEPFAGELVLTSLGDLGAVVRTGVSPVRVTRDDETDAVTIVLDDGSSVTAGEVLVCTGRVPNTLDLGLETVGLTPGDWLPTDDSLRVLAPAGSDAEGGVLDGAGEDAWLYAVGDVTHRALLTHQGKYDARIAGDAIAARANGKTLSLAPWSTYAATADHASVPQVTFTDPEVASVGLSAAEAEKAGIRTRVVDYDISWVAGATIASDKYVGRARMVVDEDRRVLVGATFVGLDVGELLHSATVAIVGEVTIDRLWHAVPSYPTLSEVWLRLLEAYGRPTE